MKKKYLLELVIILLVLLGIGYYYQNTKSVSENITGMGIQKQVVENSTQSAVAKSLITYSCEKGKTAYILLKNRYKIEEKVSDLGPLVTSIEDMKPTDSQFWSFYVDGKMAPVGANTYVCNDKEKIEWKLENF